MVTDMRGEEDDVVGGGVFVYKVLESGHSGQLDGRAQSAGPVDVELGNLNQGFRIARRLEALTR